MELSLAGIGSFFAEYYMAFIWGLILIAAIIVEAQTDALIAIWFIPASGVSLILSFITKQIWIQVVVFVVLAAVLIFLSKKFFEKFLKKDKDEKTNMDIIIGREAYLEEEVNNLKGTGVVKINGVLWSVISENNDEVIPNGSLVTVKAVSGVKLVVTPIQK